MDLVPDGYIRYPVTEGPPNDDIRYMMSGGAGPPGSLFTSSHNTMEESTPRQRNQKVKHKYRKTAHSHPAPFKHCEDSESLTSIPRREVDKWLAERMPMSKRGTFRTSFLSTYRRIKTEQDAGLRPKGLIEKQIDRWSWSVPQAILKLTRINSQTKNRHVKEHDRYHQQYNRHPKHGEQSREGRPSPRSADMLYKHNRNGRRKYQSSEPYKIQRSSNGRNTSAPVAPGPNWQQMLMPLPIHTSTQFLDGLPRDARTIHDSGEILRESPDRSRQVKSRKRVLSSTKEVLETHEPSERPENWSATAALSRKDSRSSSVLSPAIPPHSSSQASSENLIKQSLDEVQREHSIPKGEEVAYCEGFTTVSRGQDLPEISPSPELQEQGIIPLPKLDTSDISRASSPPVTSDAQHGAGSILPVSSCPPVSLQSTSVEAEDSTSRPALGELHREIQRGKDLRILNNEEHAKRDGVISPNSLADHLNVALRRWSEVYDRMTDSQKAEGHECGQAQDGDGWTTDDEQSTRFVPRRRPRDMSGDVPKEDATLIRDGAQMRPMVHHPQTLIESLKVSPVTSAAHSEESGGEVFSTLSAHMNSPSWDWSNLGKGRSG